LPLRQISTSWCGQGDDVRTQFEPFLHDPEFQEIIANIKKIRSMVVEVEHMQPLLPSADDARESNTGEEAAEAAR
jgi:hypothetical protein